MRTLSGTSKPHTEGNEPDAPVFQSNTQTQVTKTVRTQMTKTVRTQMIKTVRTSIDKLPYKRRPSCVWPTLCLPPGHLYKSQAVGAVRHHLSGGLRRTLPSSLCLGLPLWQARWKSRKRTPSLGGCQYVQ